MSTSLLREKVVLRKKLLLYGLVALILAFTLGGVWLSYQSFHKGHASVLGAKRRGSDILGARPFPDTWNNTHAFLTFNYNISNSAAVASHYDFVWAADPASVVPLHTANPNIFLTYYIPFHRDFGTYATTGTPLSLSSWKTAHADWILYKCDRVTPAYEYKMANVPLDFANPAVIAWQMATYALPASTHGYDGIAADNLDMQNSFGACGSYKNGTWVQRYSGQANDTQWSADAVNWLTQMQSALHTLPHPLALIPNLRGVSVGNPLLPQVLTHSDGVLDEGGFTAGGTGYLTDSQWTQGVALMAMEQQLNKPFYSINLFSNVTPATIQWALASYLMAKGHTAALYIAAANGYGSDAWHSEYAAHIGSPLGAMYTLQNVYCRDYSGGASIVNPSSTTSYTVTLNPANHYVDLYGHAVGATLTLAPHTGIVLLYTSTGNAHPLVGHPLH